MNAHGLRYFTTAATRQALIEESQSRIREAALRREHARLVAEHSVLEHRQAELEEQHAHEFDALEQSPETGHFSHDA